MRFFSLCICALALPTLALASPKAPDPPVTNAAPCPPGATTLCVPLDATFQVARFDGVGGNGPADPLDPCQRNDDDYSLAVPLQFTFNLYGTTYTNVFINNNGNISFNDGYATFTPTGFPVSGFPMVAPLWGDVDTRNGSVGDGVVYYRSDPHQFIVIWDHVGYYNTANDKMNTFELIISDGTADGLPGLGHNVCFCYDGMYWTTGDASGGVGGLGGVPATVGVNKGDGVSYFLVGLFDHEGFDYDGPGGANDGINYLTTRTICFDASGSTNQPPIAFGFPRGDSALCVGLNQTLTYEVQFTGPELGQTVHTTVNPNGLLGLTYTSTDGNPSVVTIHVTPDMSQDGQTFAVELTATDDGTPALSTTRYLYVKVGCATPVEGKTWGQIKALYR